MALLPFAYLVHIQVAGATFSCAHWCSVCDQLPRLTHAFCFWCPLHSIGGVCYVPIRELRRSFPVTVVAFADGTVRRAPLLVAVTDTLKEMKDRVVRALPELDVDMIQLVYNGRELRDLARPVIESPLRPKTNVQVISDALLKLAFDPSFVGDYMCLAGDYKTCYLDNSANKWFTTRCRATPSGSGNGNDSSNGFAVPASFAALGGRAPKGAPANMPPPPFGYPQGLLPPGALGGFGVPGGGVQGPFTKGVHHWEVFIDNTRWGHIFLGVCTESQDRNRWLGTRLSISLEFVLPMSKSCN
jgi:hypothetical protein